MSACGITSCIKIDKLLVVNILLTFCNDVHNNVAYTVKSVLAATQKEDQKLLSKTDYHLMKVKSTAECSNRAYFPPFIKLPFVFKTFVLYI